MRVSELKAWLKSVEDEFNGSDPEIGIDVLAGKHIEFWSMNLGGAHFIKKDNCLSLFQVRLRSPIPRGALLKVKVPGLDSLECNLHDAIARFVEEYEVSGDLKAWQEQDIDMQEFTVAVIKEDVSRLVCLADVCASLQLTNANNIVNQIKEEFSIPMLNIGMVTRPDGSRIEVNFITEPQLYFVMMRSRAKVAREFRQWICNEVLPSIRAQGAYVGNEIKNEVADKEAKNYDWYIGQLTELFEKNKVSKEVLVSTINIAQRVFKTGYVVALKNTADNHDKPKADEKVTLTEDEITAIDHMVYYHDKFRPDTLKAYKKIAEIQAQATKLLLTIQDIPSAQLYESATAPDISAQKLKRFNTTKVKKGELVVSA